MLTIETKFFTVLEIAAALRIDRHAVVKMFADEKDVVRLGIKETTRKRRGDGQQRRYVQLRIPEHVFNRVAARLANK